MPTRERLAALGTVRGRRLIRDFGEEIRSARLAAGLSQASVAAAVGLSQEQLSRYELGQPPHPDLLQAARVARIVGLELSVRCFAASGQLRDQAHVALINRLLSRIGSTVAYRLEVPIRPADQRAWDVLLVVGSIRIGVIAETRIRDLQALLRREHRKQIDSDVQHLLLLVADSRHNRAALADAGELLATSYPLRTRGVLTRLGRGEAPESNAIVIL